MLSNRPPHVNQTDLSARFPLHGVFVAPELAVPSSRKAVAKPLVQDDSTSEDLTIPAWVEVELAAGSNAYMVHTMVLDPADGGLVAEQNATVVCDATSATTSNIEMKLKVVDGLDIRWWSVKDPFLYTVKTSLYLASDPAQVFDEHETSTGFRTTAWDNTGFYLNDQLLTLRGFSHHSSLAGIGTALSPRINLFKVQASKALGANTWRMSHNPYTDSLYKILDITGQVGSIPAKPPAAAGRRRPSPAITRCSPPAVGPGSCHTPSDHIPRLLNRPRIRMATPRIWHAVGYSTRSSSGTSQETLAMSIGCRCMI